MVDLPFPSVDPLLGTDYIRRLVDDYARRIESALRAKGFRVAVDTTAEKLGAKIRNAQLWKTPYMVVVGGRDEAAGVVSVRSRTDGDLGQMALDAFISRLDAELAG